MKKITAIFILSVFIYNCFGFLAIYPLLSAYYKYLGMQEANKPSKEEMVELLIFDKAKINSGELDFRWTHSREFKYNGDMYDIVKKEETDKILIVYCVNDTKEKNLEKEFHRNIENSIANKKRNSNRSLIKYLLSEAVCFNIGKSTDSNKLAYGLWYIQNYISAWEEIPSPPPKYYS